MLNSTGLNSNLHSTPTENQNRIDDLMSAITQARKSLQNWQDQKTEALIKLDALSYDIRMISEEKDRANESAAQTKKEMENEVRIYQNHVDNLSDQVQLLQIEREGLQNQLNQALQENQNQLKELARLKTSEQKLQSDLKNGIAAMQVETEARLSAKYEELYQGEIDRLKKQLQELNDQNRALMSERSDAEERSARFERELDGIRSHMMSVLRVAEKKETAPAESHPAPEKIDARKLRAVEIESGSVDEYLKRLGY